MQPEPPKREYRENDMAGVIRFLMPRLKINNNSEAHFHDETS
jgi:hypothetical protein